MFYAFFFFSSKIKLGLFILVNLTTNPIGQTHDHRD